MAFLARLGRSLLRIIVVVLIVAGIGLAALAMALRQPALTSMSFKGLQRARSLAKFVKRAIAGSGGIRVVSFSGPRETSDASDHRNYWSHGWKAVVITDTAFLRNPNYHTRHDTADTLDYQRMAGVVDGVLNAALHASDR